MKRFAQLSAAIGAALAGLGAAIFLHPRSGAQRRTAAAGAARRQSANVATLVGGSVGLGSRHRRGDADLVTSVRDQLAAAFGEAAAAIDVAAHHGTVTLRGEVPEIDDIDAFEDAARSAGAADVNNLLRLPVAHDKAPTTSSS